MGGRIVDGTAIHLQLSLKSGGTRKIQKRYALGESNPLLILGRDSCYHYTKSVYIYLWRRGGGGVWLTLCTEENMGATTNKHNYFSLYYYLINLNTNRE
jgi:hypothetical protein